MLCDTCQRQEGCLPSLLAKSDEQLKKMLHRLKKCDLRIVKSN